MSPIDYEALRGEGGEPEIPEDINRVARLDRAALVDTNNGERLVTEWRDYYKPLIQWQSWNRFDTTGMSYTRDLLKAIGVDMSTLTDDVALSSELSVASGGVFKVHTSSQLGNRGDRVFVTTYVDGKATGTDLQMPLVTDELGTDTRGLPPVAPPAPGAPQPAAAPAGDVPWEDDTPPF